MIAAGIIHETAWSSATAVGAMISNGCMPKIEPRTLPPEEEPDDFASALTAEEQADLDADLAEEARAEATQRVRVDVDDEWRDLLITKKATKKTPKGVVEILVPLPNVSNAITILRYHPKWREVLAFDAFAERIVTRKPPPWHPSTAPSLASVGEIRETDTARIVDWFARVEGLAMSEKTVEQAVPVVAESAAFHPVREYLAGLKWDGKQRLPTMLSTYFCTEDTPYTRAIGMRWMISAVARVMKPGCQADCTLILESKAQGVGKSSAFRALVPDPSFYSETGVTIGDKDSYQALHGLWIFLFDELDSLKRVDITKTKNFLTSTKDHLRPTYGKKTRDFQRQNVFCGTTNSEEYFVDQTGNRRYWPVRVLGDIDRDIIERDRDQLWGEAKARYDSGEPWHVDTPELRRLCEEQQKRRMQPDDWAPLIVAWLKNPIGWAWEENEHGKRTQARVPLDLSAGVLTTEIALYALQMRPSDIHSGVTQRIAGVLRSLGYTRGDQHREGDEVVRRYLPPPRHQAPPSDSGKPGDNGTPKNALPNPPVTNVTK